MRIFLTTLMLFLTAMVVHLAIWKAGLPKNQTRALLWICLLVFAGWLAVSIERRTAVLVTLHVALYYWSVSFCYIITYSAIEGDSPTLSLMRFVAQNGADGRSPEEIERFTDERPFIDARLVALVNSGFIRLQEGRYFLAGRESLAFRLILGFRRLYGPIPKGG